MTAGTFTLRAPVADDRSMLLSIAVATQRFAPEEAESLLGGVLDAYSSTSLGEGHELLVACTLDTGTPVGWSYFAPDMFADGVWNLWWIGVAPGHHGSGAGRALLRAVEAHVTQAGARVLVIETSDAGGLARARRFYEREGYTARGVVPEFYGVGDGKVIFSKTLAG